MPADAAVFFLLRTYTAEAGSVPTRTTARPGVMPCAACSAPTPSRTLASTFCATALPSRVTRPSRTPRSWQEAEALDRGRAPRLGIDRDHHAVQRGRALGRLEPDRHLGEEPLQDLLAIHADHAVQRARHPEIGDVRGAARQDPLVGGLDVTVRADDGADFPVQPPAHGDRL